MDIRGKNIVYVGGFGGIGFAACKGLMLKNISSLVILEIRECADLLNELKALNPLVNVLWFKLDLCNKESIKQAITATIDKVEFIDVLVNGSGVINEKDIELAVGTNLIGVINTNLIAIPYMDKSTKGRGGMVINVSSLLGLVPSPSSAVYSATKHAVIGFTRSLSDEYYYERTGIMMVLFCPGLTNTALLDNNTKLTFPYSAEVEGKIMNVKSQTADECGKCLVKTIECATNGSIWTSVGGVLDEVEMGNFVAYRPIS